MILRIRFFGTLLFTLLFYTLPINAQSPFRVMCYNVENLFDTADDPCKEDNEFLPDGNRYWTRGRYYHKLRQIAKTISAAGEWDTPALVGLCEVENDSGFGYIGHEAIPIRFTRERHKQSRDILHVWGKIQTGDTLDVFVCHFPSRYGGEKESEQDRLDAARTLRENCDSIYRIRKFPYLIIMGDFNDTPQDRGPAEILQAHPFTSHTQSPATQEPAYYNLFAHPRKGQPQGSHKYQGAWSQLDQIIVSQTFLAPGATLRIVPESIRIFAPDFLLTNDKTWRGLRPFRTYYGFKYEGGFSDHLPLIVDFYLHLPTQTKQWLP